MESFTKGDRVQVSEYGRQRGIRSSKKGSKNGIVTSVLPFGYIHVVSDGTKTPVRYSSIFWERIETNAIRSFEIQ